MRDLDQAVDDWKRILSVLDPEQAEREPVRVERFGPESDPVRWATFISDSGAEIQLVEPLGDGPRGQQLAEHGEGVDHICFVNPDVPDVVAKLDAEGVELTGTELRTDHRMPWQGWTFITEEAGHGVAVEIAYPYRAEQGEWRPLEDAAED